MDYGLKSSPGVRAILSLVVLNVTLTRSLWCSTDTNKTNPDGQWVMSQITMGLWRISRSLTNSGYRTREVSKMSSHNAETPCPIECATYQHYDDIKNICRPEQYDQLRNLVSDLIRTQQEPSPDDSPPLFDRRQTIHEPGNSDDWTAITNVSISVSLRPPPQGFRIRLTPGTLPVFLFDR